MADEQTPQLSPQQDDFVRLFQTLNVDNRTLLTTGLPTRLMSVSSSGLGTNQETRFPVQERRFQNLGGNYSSQLGNNLGISLETPVNYWASHGDSKYLLCHDHPSSSSCLNRTTTLPSFNPYAYPAPMHSYPSSIANDAATMASNHLSSPVPNLQRPIVDNQEDISNFLYFLRFRQGWTEQKIHKLYQDDASLLDELHEVEIFMMAKNQLGSQYLQNILGVETSRKILEAVIYGIVDLMSHPSGAYVFQKLLKCCHQEHIHWIAHEIIRNSKAFQQAASTQFGSVSFQKLLYTLKRLSSPFINYLMWALNPGFLQVMMTVAGKHLVKYCLRTLTYGQNEPLYKAAIEHCLELGRDKEGYQILIDVIKTITEPFRTILLAEITEHSVHLSQEPNGNYVVQKVLELENPCITANICNRLKTHIVHLSMHKHSSHVIEKCLESPAVDELVFELLKSNKLIQLARDQYGNYVIQRVLALTKTRRPDLYRRVVNCMIPQLKSLQNHPSARNLYNILHRELSLCAV